MYLKFTLDQIVENKNSEKIAINMKLKMKKHKSLTSSMTKVLILVKIL